MNKKTMADYFKIHEASLEKITEHELRMLQTIYAKEHRDDKYIFLYLFLPPLWIFLLINEFKCDRYRHHLTERRILPTPTIAFGNPPEWNN